MAKILVVDDSKVVREQLRATLTRASHDVVACENGHAGYQAALAQDDIKLIIADYNMPEMNGLDMIQRIRKVPAYVKTPIFMLTTESSPVLKESAISMGITAWINKPFSPAPLLAGVEKVLGMADKAVGS